MCIFKAWDKLRYDKKFLFRCTSNIGVEMTVFFNYAKRLHNVSIDVLVTIDHSV